MLAVISSSSVGAIQEANFRQMISNPPSILMLSSSIMDMLIR
jgi:hypothetical protein